MRDFSTGEVAVETARLAPKMSTTILPWICLPLTHHAKMPFMQYVRVTHNGRIIVLQSETHTHIIAASTTTEQDVGSNRNFCSRRVGFGYSYLLDVKVYKGEYQTKVLRH